jgi:hypothetical protein
MPTFTWNAQGTERAHVGDTPHPYSASGTVGAKDLADAKKQVTADLARRGCTVARLIVTPDREHRR